MNSAKNSNKPESLDINLINKSYEYSSMMDDTPTGIDSLITPGKTPQGQINEIFRKIDTIDTPINRNTKNSTMEDLGEDKQFFNDLINL